MINATAEAVVRQVFGTHDCRLFGVTPVRFECRCTPSRVADLVRALGAAEARAAITEQGALEVTCEFCGRDYRYDAVDVEQMFAPESTVQHGTGRVN